jgi:hypothetical protein
MVIVLVSPVSGTLNVHENAPVLFVVKEPVVQLVMRIESKASDPSTLDAAKPVPATVTVEPTRPDAGVTVIEGVTVNVCAPVGMPDAVSVATTR